ncbi:MAG: nucleotidyltransferase [Bacteroidales bacterium]|jgi:dTDP-glucose pyrophosphorylase|nr:nucleotidyltransferase [Bacteroidales bacterium]
MNRYTLLVLAAGMGSRYGGLKQIEKLGPGGETLIDYSIYDAMNAGFENVIFVIRKSIEDEFKETVMEKYKNKIAIDYVLQEINNVPFGFKVPPKREKPWGTAHAILMAKEKIHDFFAVINGDDFYGRNSFVLLFNYLNTLSLSDTKSQAMVAYSLCNTLSENGTVSRGICTVNQHQYLEKIVEHTKISRCNSKIINHNNEQSQTELNPGTPVSMNFWGFHPSIFNAIEDLFVDFLKKHIDNPSSEFYIPSVIDDLLQAHKIQVKVLQTNSQWYGVTYKEDSQYVSAKFKEMVQSNIYPPVLWQ